MPTKVYRFNSWFEVELSSLLKTGQLPPLNRQKQNRNAFLERLFLALSLPDDIVLVSEPVPNNLLQHWKEKNWIHSNRIIITSGFSEEENLLLEIDSSKTELFEFGYIRSITNSGIVVDPNKWKPSAFWNSRVNQWNFSKEESVSNSMEEGRFSILEDMEVRTIQSVDDLQDILSIKMETMESIASSSFIPFLFKADYSSSGKGHILWRGARDNHRLQKLEFPVVMETYHENRIHDFGVLLDFTNSGIISSIDKNSTSVKLLGISEMMIGKDFQFKGCTFYNYNPPNWLQNVQELFTNNPTILRNWENFRYTVESDNTADSEGQKEMGYIGAAAWDGYILESGEIRLRSEINFRMSLGRIAWEIHEKRKRVIQEQGSLLATQLPLTKAFGIMIFHNKEKFEFPVEYELTLTVSESEPWRVVYWEG